MTKWKITIPNFLGGFAPAWYLSSYPSYGNKNMAGDMKNVNLIDPNCVTQGPGLATLTNGDQSGVVTTLIKGILDKAVASDVSYAIGGNKLYKITSTEVVSDANFPHTIDHPSYTNENGEDVAYFQGNLYYSYNHSDGGDVGKYDISGNSFDDDWLSTTGGFSLQNAPHPMIVGGNDFLYVANGRYITSYDGETITEKDLDLPQNAVIQSLVWTLNRLWIAVNRPSLTGSNKTIGSIYVWDGYSPSWEDEIRIKGKIGTLYVKDGVIYVFYQDVTSGNSKLGYFTGSHIRELVTFKGSLPAYYQVTEYQNFLIWLSDNLIYAFGAVDKNLPSMLFQIASATYSNAGGLATPFGTPIVASYQDTNYQLAKFSGYTTDCYWKSLMFEISDEEIGYIDKVIVNTKPLATGARVDVKITYNEGKGEKTLGSISYANDGNATRKVFKPHLKVENFRIELDWSNGSTSNPVSVRSIHIFGHTLAKE